MKTDHLNANFKKIKTMKSNIKTLIHIIPFVLTMVFLPQACSKWTDTERDILENQEGLKRRIPYLEAESMEDLTLDLQEYFKNIKEYRETRHVKGFGWFGNWTGKGDNPQNYLKALPDSVDFVNSSREETVNKELARTGVALDAVLARYGVSSIAEMDDMAYQKALAGLKKTKSKVA